MTSTENADMYTRSDRYARSESESGIQWITADQVSALHRCATYLFAEEDAAADALAVAIDRVLAAAAQSVRGVVAQTAATVYSNWIAAGMPSGNLRRSLDVSGDSADVLSEDDAALAEAILNLRAEERYAIALWSLLGLGGSMVRQIVPPRPGRNEDALGSAITKCAAVHAKADQSNI